MLPRFAAWGIKQTDVIAARANCCRSSKKKAAAAENSYEGRASLQTATREVPKAMESFERSYVIVMPLGVANLHEVPHACYEGAAITWAA